MVEGDGAVVGEVFADQDVAVEAGEVRDGKDADGAEALGVNVKDIALRDIADELAVGIALQAEEGGGSGLELAFQGAAGDVRLFGRIFHQPVHNELIFHAAVFHAAGGGIAAMEAHKQVFGLGAFQIHFGFEHIGGDGIVDIEQGNSFIAGQQAKVFAERAIHINLAGGGNAAGRESGIDIAGHKAESLFKCGPAFIGKSGILAGAKIGRSKAAQRDLKAGEFGQQVGIGIACAQFRGHFAHGGSDGRIALFDILVEQQHVQLAVFHDFHAEVVEGLDGTIAGEEVLGPRAESEDLQTEHAQDDARDGFKMSNLRGEFFRQADGHLRDINRQVAQTEIVRGVQHAAKGIPAVAHEGIFALFGGGASHDGAHEFLREDGEGSFGAEIAQINHRGVGPGLVTFHQGLHGMDFVFDNSGAGKDLQANLFTFVNHSLHAFAGKLDGETIAADADDGELYFGGIRHIYHGWILSCETIFYKKSGDNRDFSLGRISPASDLHENGSSKLYFSV